MAATIQAMVGPDPLQRIITNQSVSPSTRFTVTAQIVRPGVSTSSNGHNSQLKGLTLPTSSSTFTGISRQRKCGGVRIITCSSSSSTEALAKDADAWEKTVKQPDAFTESSGYIAESSLEEADQFDEYNAEKFAAVFKRRPLLLTRRLVQVAGTLGWWGIVRLSDNLLGKKEQNFKKRAEELRSALVKLGPAFVKIAQAVSSRPDVIAPEYLEELALLHDRIAPFSTDHALHIIEEDLGLTVDQLFSELSREPIAAASLGQVYRAKLRPNNEPVAIKVQRPGVRATVSLDLFIMRKLATIVERVLKLNTDLPGVVDEWATTLFQEMDYRTEAQNASRFRKMFGTIPEVVVPEMYTELTSRRVLVMEWVEGQRLSEVCDLRLVEVGVFCSLTQLLDSGYYHADPHPGNLLRTAGGKLAYLDFGMMGEMNEELRDGLIEACVHLVNQEYDELAGDFVNLGLVPPNSEMGEFSKALTGVFQEAVAKGVRNISFGDLSEKLGLTMYKFKFRIPSYFSLVIRSLTVLEGIALSSDPNYKVLSSSYPWIANKVLTDKSPKLRSTLQDMVFKDGEFRIDRLESLLIESMRQPYMEDHQAGGATKNTSRKESDEAKVDSRNLLKRLLIFGLTDQGDFVRELILDELAKGLDALNRVAFDAATHTIRTRSPIALPIVDQVAPITEDEDLKNLENLRQIFSIFQRSAMAESSSVDGEAASGMPVQSGKGVGAARPNLHNSGHTTAQDLQPTRPVNGQFQSQNGAATSSNGQAGRMQKTRRVLQTANSNGRMEKMEKSGQTYTMSNTDSGNFRGANGSVGQMVETRLTEPSASSPGARGSATSSNYNGNGNGRAPSNTQLVRSSANKTGLVKAADSETALSMNDVTEIVQGLSGLTQYLPLLSVVPELPLQAQQQAILLPAELATRVASRALARSIRRTVPRKGRGRFSSAKSSDLTK